VSFTQLAYTINGPLIAYGMGCFFWIPFANKLGVRLAFLTSSAGASLFGIWAALAPDFGQFVAARVISSFFYAAPEAFGPQIVADVFFLHERATFVSVFTVCQFSGFTMAGLIGGFAGQNLGWRWPSGLMVILSGAAFFVIFILFPETTYTKYTPLQFNLIVDGAIVQMRNEDSSTIGESGHQAAEDHQR
jgi:MFS family permease